MKYTTESYKNKVYQDSNGDIEFIDQYTGYNKLSKFRCKNGHEFLLKPYRFNCGDRCKYCSGKNKPTIEEIKEYVENNYPEYELLSAEYINRDYPLQLKHKKCGNENVFISYNNLKFSKVKELCDLCKIKVQKFDNNLYLARFNRIHSGRLELLQNFEDTKDDHIKVKCNECEHEWYPNKFWVCRYKNPTGCPKCKSSKGEAEIRKVLDKLNIYYEEQYPFDDLKIQRVFHFDFYVKFKDKFFLIEYDGEFHFKPFSNSERSIKKFEDTKMRDEMKNNYCKQNNIDLLRIKYTEFKNIEAIIKNKINEM